MSSKSLFSKFPFIVQSLRNAKANERLAHAYLVHYDNQEICGEFVLFLTKLISCYNSEEKIPCGKCSRCISLEKGYYADLYKLEANSKSRRILIGDEKESNTMRYFQSKFYYSTAVVGNKKIGIIYDADRMVEEAQNAFLKTLEEPPLDTYFILLTSNKKSLLPTIISRCHYISLLTNQVEYEFKYSRKLFSILYEITTCKKSILEVEKGRIGLFDVFGSLLEDAKNETLAENDPDDYENLSTKAKKQLTEQLDAGIKSRYISKKNEIVNAILVWFSEIYQISVGITQENLALNKVFSELDENNLLKDVSLETSSNMLKSSERFYTALKYNIDENLAITDLVINLIYSNVLSFR